MVVQVGDSVVDPDKNLTVASGNAVFNGAVGAGAADLGTISVAGTTTTSSNITTSGTQTYTGAFILTGEL